MKHPKPRNGLVLVRIPKKDEIRTAAGIIVPTHAGQQYDIGEIIELGRGTPDGRGSDTDDLQVGQQVLLTVGAKGPELGAAMQYSAIPLSDADDLFLINQHDIFCIMPNEPKKPTLTYRVDDGETNDNAD